MKNKKIKNVCIIIFLFVFFIYLTICVNSIVYKNKLSFFSYKFYSMTLDSKEANAGDLIIGKNVSKEELKENDNIIYEVDGNTFVKKIIAIERKNNEINFIVEECDSNLNASIKGKAVKNIRGLGNLAMVIQSPIGTINIITIGICAYIIIRKINSNKYENINNNSNEGKGKE